MDAIETDLSPKKLHATSTLEAATEAARECLDVETSVDKELLDSVICEEVKHKTKKLSSELGQLEMKLQTLGATTNDSK